MTTFLGGQIREEHRGDLGLVITREKAEQGKGEFYGVFLYQILSEEFIHLTGMRAATTPVERVYSGVNQPIGNEIARDFNNAPVKTDLMTIDRLLVYPYFLKE